MLDSPEPRPDARLYEYGIAGQLLAVTDPDGARAGYGFDGLGRRSRLIAPDGSWTEYAWGANGSLAGTTVRTPDGGKVARHNLMTQVKVYKNWKRSLRNKISYLGKKYQILLI
jgi:YD repeat-containing protein